MSYKNFNMNGLASGVGVMGRFIGDISDASRSQVDLSDMDYTYDQINSPYDVANFHTKLYDTNSINAPSADKQALNVFSKMNEGAEAGAGVNVPWGLLIGAGLGLVGGFTEALTQNSTYRNNIAKANYGNIASTNTANKMIEQGVDKLATMSGTSDKFNNNIIAYGGPMNSQYTNQNLYNTNTNVIGAGGIHETNPNGGVPQGVDGSGTPNLVEEGEFVYTDLDSGEKRVLSNRIKPDPVLFSKFNLNEKLLAESYAKSAEKIAAMFEGRNDPFSNKTKNMLLNRLFEAQEEQKLNQAAAEQGMTPEEYVAVIQQQQMQEQAMQQQMATQQQQQQYPPEVMQLAQQYGVSPEEIMAQMQQQQGQQVPPEMMAYDESILPEEGMQGNYGALGGTFEYGFSDDESPVMEYDNYLLQRSRVNTNPVNMYAGGGPLDEEQNRFYNWVYNNKSKFPSYVDAYNKENNTNYTPAQYMRLSIDGKDGPVHAYNRNFLNSSEQSYDPNEHIQSWPTRTPISSYDDYLHLEDDSDALSNVSTNSQNQINNWDRVKNILGIMNPLRFSGAIDAFNSWVNPEPLDTEYSDFLKSQYNPITYTGPIGRHQVFHPVDSYRNLGLMQAARAAAIARNNEMSPNNRVNIGANMAVDRMFYNQLGDMYTRDTQTNLDRLNNVIAYNNQLDAANAARLNEIHQYNNQHKADTVGRGAAAREASKDARKAAIDQARNTYVQNLQNIGQELSYRSSIDSNPSFLYSSYNNYKTLLDYQNWLKHNNLDDSQENWKLFTQTV